MDKLHKLLTEQWKAEKLTHETGSGILNSVREIAQKAGITPPDVYIADSFLPYGNVATYGAFSMAKDKIVFTRPLLKLLESEDMHATPSAGVRAIIGHELSHCKFRGSEVPKLLLPPLLLPLAGAAGVYLYQKVKTAAPATSQETQQALHNESEKLEQTISQTAPHPGLGETEREAKRSSVRVGKIIAGAGLGLVSGILLSRHFSRLHELRADRLGVEWAGGGEALIEGLNKIERATESYIKSHGIGDIKSPGSLAFAAILMNHPKNAERAAKLGLNMRM